MFKDKLFADCAWFNVTAPFPNPAAFVTFSALAFTIKSRSGVFSERHVRRKTDGNGTWGVEAQPVQFTLLISGY